MDLTLAQSDPLVEFNATSSGTLREKVQSLEAAMFAHPEHVTELPVRHIFARGLYARELTIPAGMVATGRIHCEQHLFIISKGELSILMDDGPVKVSAPYSLVTEPGVKRVVFAHTDCVVTTVHATPLTDVPALEKTLTVSSFAEYEMRMLASPGE